MDAVIVEVAAWMAAGVIVGCIFDALVLRPSVDAWRIIVRSRGA